MNAEIMETLCADDLNKGVHSLVTILPKVREYIAPTLNIAYNMQHDIGDLNMKKTAVSNNGMWQSCICVNFQTAELHTENDCTYTVITTPNQAKIKVPIFIFELKKGCTIGLQMNPGLTFMFSGKYLCHRQMILDGNQTNDSSFINLASYGNEKLYNHLKTTIRRVKS